MDYFILALTSVMLGVNGIISGLYNKKKESCNPLFFLVVQALTVFLFFWAINGFRFSWNTTTFFYAIGYGVAYLFISLFGLLAYAIGNVALTSLITSYSLILPTLYGVFFEKEKTGVLFWIALLLLGISLFLINFKSKAKEEGTEQPRSEAIERAPVQKSKKGLWAIYASLAFLGNGFCSILQSAQQKATDGGYKSELMMLGMLFVLLVCGGLLLTLPKCKLKKPQVGRTCAYGSALGITNGGVNFFVMLLLGSSLAVSLIFPLISAISLLVSYVLSAVIFKDKLSLWQNVGFALGVASVVLFNL